MSGNSASAVNSAAKLHLKEIISLDQTNGTDEKYQLARIAIYDVPASARNITYLNSMFYSAYISHSSCSPTTQNTHGNLHRPYQPPAAELVSILSQLSFFQSFLPISSPSCW
jgi:hypothetical protein